MDAGEIQLSSDKKLIAYSGAEYTDVLPRTNGLYLFDIETGETKTIVAQGKMSVGAVHFMGDGRLFYTGTTFEFSGRNPRYYIYDITADAVKEHWRNTNDHYLYGCG